MSEYAITVTNLTKRFDDITAVDNLSLEIGWGELFGILGPNGAGKSTLVNILSTLLDPTDGSATVDDHDVIFDPDSVREVIGVCPQKLAFYPHLTGEENIPTTFAVLTPDGAEHVRNQMVRMRELVSRVIDKETKLE